MQRSDGCEADDLFFFSAPASPVHYILRSPPSSTAPSAAVDGDCCGGHGAGAVGDFEFFAARAGGMSSAEELFAAGRIRVGGGDLSPIRRDEAGRADQEYSGDEEEEERDSRDGGCAHPTRRARSASPPRSPRAAATGAAPSSDPFASGSSSSSSSSSAKNTRRRISLRDLLAGTVSGDCRPEQGPDTAGGSAGTRSGFWTPSIWPSRAKKKALPPCPAPLPGRRSASSDRSTSAPAKKLPPGGTARRTTSLPYQQGLVLGCLGFGARSYGLAKSMHPLYSR